MGRIQPVKPSRRAITPNKIKSISIGRNKKIRIGFEGYPNEIRKILEGEPNASREVELKRIILIDIHYAAMVIKVV